MISEVAIVTGAALIGISAWLGFGLSFLLQSSAYRTAAMLFALVMVICMGIAGMYQIGKCNNLWASFLRLVPAGALAIAVMTLLVMFVPTLPFDEKGLSLVSAFSLAGVTMSRTLFSHSLKNASLRTKILFLGTGAVAKECKDLILESNLERKYEVIGYVPMACEQSTIILNDLILQEKNSLKEIAERYGVNEVVVSVDNRRGGTFPIDELLQCKLHGIKVIDATAFFERELRQIRIDSLQPSWLVFGGGFDQSLFRVACKRTVDIVMSTLLCFLTWPLLLATAAAIYIEDRGPIFYRQERVGLGGVGFMVLKFRSMRKDAESSNKPQWASSNDDRATTVGRFIRKYRIDEIPQIINVLSGDMSFVGPRPERPFFVTKLIEDVQFYDVRHSIKPGITGLAQVRYQYGASVADAIQKLQYDLYYVKNNSLSLDAMILFETLHVVLFGKGAR